MSYTCPHCGNVHIDLPHVGMDRPDHWWDIPQAEREQRIRLTEDTCVIDETHFFIRGVIEIPVHGRVEAFGFGAWLSQKQENFRQYVSNSVSGDIGPFFGWLCTTIGYYSEDTQLLKCMAHFQGGGLRPRIELEPADHPLAVDQREGISLDKAWEIVHFYGGIA